MRYTTFIDITEMAAVWKNHNAGRLYIWLCAKSGYHDDDRDLIDASLHAMEANTGMSFSAVRNAVKQLEKAGLLHREDNGLWRVKKWVQMAPVTPRRQKNTARPGSMDADLGRRYEEEREARQREIMQAVNASTVAELNEAHAALINRHTHMLHGCRLQPSAAFNEWLSNYIKNRQHDST